MSIVGIGTDIVQIKRIRHIWQRYAMRFARRILTSKELKRLGKVEPVMFLAKRFAAKEAIVKALGTGLTTQVQMHCIEINNKSSGQPYVKFLAHTKQFVDQAFPASKVHISISDERDYALAFCVIDIVG